MGIRFFADYVAGNSSWLVLVCVVAATLEVALCAARNRPTASMLVDQIGMVVLRFVGLALIVCAAFLLPSGVPDGSGYWPLLGVLCNFGINLGGALWLVWHTSHWLVELLQYSFSRAWGFMLSTALLTGVSLVGWLWWYQAGGTFANYATDTKTGVVLLVSLSAMLAWVASLDHLDRR